MTRRHALARAALALSLLAGFTALSLHQARIDSATYDEPVHLAAGLASTRWSDFRLNPEHPPLVKQVAALPLRWLDPWPGARPPSEAPATAGAATRSLGRLSAAWSSALTDANAQWIFAHTLLYGMNDRALARLGAPSALEVDPTAAVRASDYVNPTDRLLFWSRSAVLSFGVCLALLVFAWARDLYGSRPALLALALFCFDPGFVAHAALVATDVAAALFFAATFYGLWRWSRRPTLANAGLFVAGVALSFVSKYSAVGLLPIAAVALAPSVLRLPARERRRRLAGCAGLAAAAGLAALAAVWADYGFRWSASPEPGHRLPLERVLRETAVTRALLEPGVSPPSPREYAAAVEAAELGAGERALLALGRSRLLPEAYVYGAAIARRKGLARYSFLRGEISLLGFPSYFLWCFLLKTPLVTLALVAASTALQLRRPRAHPELDFLLVPALAYLGLSSLTSLHIGHRHLLPIYPGLYVLCASLLEWPPLRRLGRLGLGGAIGAALLSASLVFAPPWRPTPVQPHPLAFFNELAGGPAAGHRQLVDSNLDWGQDLKKLARWLDERGIREPIGLCYFGSADPRYHGIRHYKLPGGYGYEPPFASSAGFALARRPGWVAISATNLAGVYFGEELREAWRRLLADAELVDVVGHSIFVYRLAAPGVP